MSGLGMISIPLSDPVEAEIISLKVKVGERVCKGSNLFSYKVKNETSTTLFKSQVVGVVREVFVKEGDHVHKQDAVLFIEERCDHSMVAFNLCAICGVDLKSDKEASERLSMLHNVPQVTVSQQEAHRLGNKDKQQLLDSRKLALIVDLDQTLVHTSVDPNIERGLPDVYGFTLPGHTYLYHCRLRPYAREFLQTVSRLFELHVFTMATKDYAYAVTQILDPEKKLFSDRVISRDECFDPHSKAPRLKSVFPCGDEMVAIIDDREDVWGACPNLIHVKPYMFFAGTADINAPPTRPQPPHANRPPPLSANKTTAAAASSHRPKERRQDLTSNKSTIKNNNNNNNNNKKGKSNGTVASVSSSSSSESSSDSSSSSSDSDSSEENEEGSGKTRGEEGTQDHSHKIDQTPEIPMEVDKCHVLSEGASPNAISTIDNGGPSTAVVEHSKKLNEKPSIKDTDDFLVHLGDILTRIHNTFYSEYDKKQKEHEDNKQEQETPLQQKDIKTPDLKEIIPRLRKSVFTNCNILFSGVIPLGMPIERSREWNTARAFGGCVHSKLVPGLDSADPEVVSQATTHLVVGRPDTSKYKQAKKVCGIKIVSPRWFWASAEQWMKAVEDDYLPTFTQSVSTEKPKKEESVSKDSKSNDNNIIDGKNNSIVKDDKPPQDAPLGFQVHPNSVGKQNPKTAPTTTSGTSGLSRTFSVSSEQLEKMEAEIDAELSMDDDESDDNDLGEDLGSYVKKVQAEDEDSESFSAYLGLEEAGVNRKRKRDDVEPSSNSTSLDGEDSSSSDSGDDDDELARLLMI